MSSLAGGRLRPRIHSALNIGLLLGAGLAAHTAYALDFEWGDLKGAVTSKITVGAGWRVEERDDGLLGKLNVPGQQTLCQADDCMSFSGDPAPNQRLIAARGSYTMHANDDGDLNYDHGDLISALAKIKSSFSADWEPFKAKVTLIGFFDHANDDFEETHSNTLLQPAHTRRPKRIEDEVGLRGELREAFIEYDTEFDERKLSISAGAQRIRWGEANLHPLNTLDIINPQDAILPRQPGFALNELNAPTDLVLITTDLFDGVSGEFFYQYEWDATRAEPAGTYFSSNDIVKGSFVEAAPGQFAEDPEARYAGPGLVGLLSSASRRVLVRETGARNQGQFGARINWYAEDLNEGTEFGFYYAHYHSRLPYFSAIEAQQSCTRRAVVPANFEAAVAACANATGVFNGSLQASPSLATEPFPVNTEGGLLEYPEDINMFGMSFNTTAFGWSWSGEYSYRPNLPAQLSPIDVLYAGNQQSFPTQDIPVLASQLPGLAGVTLPGARTFIPDFITEYRGRTIESGNEYQPGEKVHGWERLKVGQFALNVLRILPSHFGADEGTLLIEGGFTHVIDMPKDLYFQGQASTSHAGPGADGSGPGTPTSLRLNPTQQTSGYATRFAWGLRGLYQLTYSGVWGSSVTLKPTLLWFQDLGGIAPSPTQNYVKGNRWMTGGLQYQMGQNFEGTLLYMYFDGAKNVLQDRDNIQISLSYTF